MFSQLLFPLIFTRIFMSLVFMVLEVHGPTASLGSTNTAIATTPHAVAQWLRTASGKRDIVEPRLKNHIVERNCQLDDLFHLVVIDGKPAVKQGVLSNERKN